MIRNVIFPQDNPQLTVGTDYRFPIAIVNPDETDEYHIGVLDTAMHITPMTKFKEGDLAMILGEVPGYIRKKYQEARRGIPRVWKIRYVVSMWTLNVMRMVQAGEQIWGVDHAMAMLEADGINERELPRALLYAHGYPHALYPNTAQWFTADALKKIALREPNVTWPVVLDGAKTRFQAYTDPGNLVLDLAPDRYGEGQRLTRPFEHEETTTHIAASLGLEEAMWRPQDPGVQHAPLIKHAGEFLVDDIT